MRELVEVEKAFGYAEEGVYVNTSYAAYRLCVSPLISQIIVLRLQIRRI